MIHDHWLLAVRQWYDGKGDCSKQQGRNSKGVEATISK